MDQLGQNFKDRDPMQKLKNDSTCNSMWITKIKNYFFNFSFQPFKQKVT